jgi:hypothetical protein
VSERAQACLNQLSAAQTCKKTSNIFPPSLSLPLQQIFMQISLPQVPTMMFLLHPRAQHTARRLRFAFYCCSHSLRSMNLHKCGVYLQPKEAGERARESLFHMQAKLQLCNYRTLHKECNCTHKEEEKRLRLKLNLIPMAGVCVCCADARPREKASAFEHFKAIRFYYDSYS